MQRLLNSVISFLLPIKMSTKASSWETDPVESRVGIHIISHFGDDPIVHSPAISEEAIHEALQSVDWINGFHQVVVVVSPGISMEVGGSLNPEHGLCAAYINRIENIEAVTKEAPETVSDMAAILFAFIQPGDGWRDIREFDF